MKPIRSSAKAVIIRDGSLLLVRNLDSEGDWYSLPGGGQRHGETLPEALSRECQEEIGCTVMVGRLMFVRDYIGANHEFADEDGDAHQIEFAFECMLADTDTPSVGRAPDPTQIGVRWIALSQLHEHRVYPRILVKLLTAGERREAVAYLGDVN